MVDLCCSMRPKGQPRTERLADLAARQHGVVSIRQLEELIGVPRRAVVRAEAAGRLHRLHHGVYAVGHTNLSLQGRCLAAVLGCGPEALLSHWSAAWLWGLGVNSPVPLHGTSPSPRSRRSHIHVHRARNLAEKDRGLREGIPVTSVARTLLDMAPLVDATRLARFLERAEKAKLLEVGTVDSVVGRNCGHRGARRLERAVAIYRPAPWGRSEFERRFVAAVLAAGLPQPAMGWNEIGLELDVYWPEARFGVELDSWETHGTRGAFERDHERDEKLALAEIETIRVTEARFRDRPAAVMEAVATLLRRQLDAGGVAQL
jgi:hypothetical protein